MRGVYVDAFFFNVLNGETTSPAIETVEKIKVYSNEIQLMMRGFGKLFTMK